MDIIESIPTAIALVELSNTDPHLCAELAQWQLQSVVLSME